MKKTVLRIFSTATTLIALFFIVFLILTTFGKIKIEELDNTIVRSIFLSLGCLFTALSIVSHVILYLNEDAVKEVILRSGKEGTARTSLAVIKKITKNTVKGIEGVKCAKCAIISNEFGIRLRVWLKIKDRDMKETEERVRAYLEDAFLGALDFRFFAIDINLKKIEAKHKVDKAAIDENLKKTAVESVEEKTDDKPVEPAEAVEDTQIVVPETVELAEATEIGASGEIAPEMNEKVEETNETTPESNN